MTVGIDIRSLVSGKRSGVEEYVTRLCEGLFNIDSDVHYALFVSGMKSEHHSLNFQSRFSNVSVRHVKWPNKVLNASLCFLGSPRIDSLLRNVDVMFFPNILFMAVSKKIPYVVTFHDLSFVHFKQFLNTRRRLWHYFVSPKKIAEGARKIIAVSRSTKEDLMDTYGIHQDKVEIIHSGASNEEVTNESRVDVVRKKYQLPEKYILCLGTLEPRKNIEGLIEAFYIFSRKNEGYHLVIAGSEGWKMKDIYKKSLKRFRKNTILFTGFIEEQDKRAVYELANLFVFLSFFEGFGFPLLEAASARVPIIASANSSIFEIIGNGALLVDPYNVLEIANAMENIIQSEVLQKNLIHRAYARLDAFKLQDASRKTLSLLKEVAYVNKKV